MKRQEKGAAREQLVVEAAAAVIAERGVANVRVADIAQQAGMSVGHVTYYFPSKAGLLIRAIQLSERALHEQVAEAIEQIVDPWERLDRLVELASPTGRGDPGWVLWFEVWATAGFDADLTKVQAELDSRWRGTLTQVIQYGCDQGAFVTADSQAVATLLSSLIDGLSIHVTLGDPEVSVEVSRDLVMRAAVAVLTTQTPELA
jgi:AcrR family transcriptional regulator